MKGTMSSSYVLLTPARNEEDFIEVTIEAVVAQTVQPRQWIIVNDGSTDRTEAVVARYADRHDFIRLVSVPGGREHGFGSKARALNHSYRLLDESDHEFVGFVDADVSFAPDYYENILQRFAENPKLGLAGGKRFDFTNGAFESVTSSDDSVCGAVQFFRRSCFEAIGGYQELPYGGIDAVAETTARMQGWDVRSYAEYRIDHHRPTGTAARSKRRSFFRAGLRDYTIGYHPLFELMRLVRRGRAEPYYGVQMAGYLYAMARRMERPVPDEFIDFIRHEQIGRLRGSLTESAALERA